MPSNQHFSAIRLVGIFIVLLFGPLLASLVFVLLLKLSHTLFNFPQNEDLGYWSFFALIFGYPLTAITFVPASMICEKYGISYWKFGLIFGISMGFLIVAFLNIPVLNVLAFSCVLGGCYGLVIAILAKAFNR